MIIDKEVSTDIILTLIVIFDCGNQYRMRRDSQRLLLTHSVLSTGNGPVNSNQGDCYCKGKFKKLPVRFLRVACTW